jgi:hypothetical protein
MVELQFPLCTRCGEPTPRVNLFNILLSFPSSDDSQQRGVQIASYCELCMAQFLGLPTMLDPK